jgi:methyltransferase
VNSQALYLLLLALIGCERLFELALSRRNAALAIAAGGVEYGRGHFGPMKVLHTAFLLGCAAEVLLLERPFVATLGVPMLALALAAQFLRYWAIATLGSAWNVRVLVVPGRESVADGPYRWIRHPNYLAVVVEGFALPLIHGAWLTAALFTVLNALLLRVRIRCEEGALARHCSYDARLGDRGRWIPGSRAAPAPHSEVS